MKLVFIGAGNVATHLAKALHSSNQEIIQIYSRTEASATSLSSQIGCCFTCNIDTLSKDADVYICALKDSALQELIPRIVANNPSAIFIHMAGSLSIDIWKGIAQNYGVLYPMQTFSKEKEVDFGKVSFFTEASDEKVLNVIDSLAHLLSSNVYNISSDQRKYLHIAAVFACNFANHMFTLSKEILQKNGISFDVMLPLIDETARKVHEMSPEKGQTGPAVRNDTNIMNAHINMLGDDEDMRDIYKKISESIYKHSKS